MWSDYPCKIWTGAKAKDGYGVKQVQGKMVYLHREALAKKLGRPLTGHALHHCDTPSCYEAEHLYEGTHSENMLDMYARGRMAHRLTAQQKQEIKIRYAAGGVTHRSLAEEYGFGKTAIWRAIHKAM